MLLVLFLNRYPVKTSDMKKIIITASGFVLLLLACSKGTVDYTADCSTTKSFATDVSPVIQTSCATNSGCHASGSSNGPGALTTYTQVYNARTAIRTAVANGSMPQNGSLLNAEKNAIICWIDNGAANN